MMDARPLYPEGHHPVKRNHTPDGMYRISPLSRTDRPVRYYFIDFDLSVRFPDRGSTYVVGDVGRDTEVPELSEDVPYDAFKVDVFALGNLYYKEFYQVSPQIPPSVLAQWLPPSLGLTTIAAVQQHGIHEHGKPARAHAATST